MTLRRLLLLLAVLATPLQAQDLLTAEEFDALTLGRTMTWADYGQVYGVEQYLPGRRVRWTELGDDCKLGHWYQEGQSICFLYEDDPTTPACWEISLSGSGMLALDLSDPLDESVVVEETTETMPCFGPEVGA